MSEILRRCQVPRLVEFDPLTGQVIRAIKTTTIRYERDRHGELVHVDVKTIGKIPDGGGWRAHGLPATKAAKSKRPGISHDFVNSLVDDHSRLAYSEILADSKGPTCAAFLLRAADYFPGHGITRVKRLMTDNAFAYRDTVAELGARHLFIEPHCP